MDHVIFGKAAAAAAPVTPVIGGASAPPTRHEFALISFDKFGNPQPLPLGLDDLPLYPHDDGYFSVNGPLGLRSFYANLALTPVNGANHSIIHPLITNIPGPLNEKSPSIPDHHLRYYNDDTISRPQTRSERRSYLCPDPGCTWKSSFQTKQALDLHHEAKHLNKSVDCPVPGCERVGDKGIKRRDNLPAHVWNKHGIKMARQSHGS